MQTFKQLSKLYYLFSVKSNASINEDVKVTNEMQPNTNSDDLSILIDKAVDVFFDKHVLRVRALGKDISVPRTGIIITFLFVLIIILWII